MEKNLLLYLRGNTGVLSAVERKITDVILSDPKKFTSYSMGELALMAGVSQGSIINFSNKFAKGGFPILKLKIAACLSEYDEKPFSVVGETDGMGEALEKTSQGIVGALKNTSSSNDSKILERVANRILNAKKVQIYGVYRSATVATDFYYQLLELGIPVSFVNDVLTCAVSAAMMTEEGVAIAVSSSGRTADIIDAVKIAKERGAATVCLTAHPNSPLAKLCDDVLIAMPSGTSVSGKDSEIRIAQLVLADSICNYLQSKIDVDGKARYFDMRKILNSHNVKD